MRYRNQGLLLEVCKPVTWPLGNQDKRGLGSLSLACRIQATFSPGDFPKLQLAASPRHGYQECEDACCCQHNPAAVGDSGLGAQVRLLPFTKTSEVGVKIQNG